MRIRMNSHFRLFSAALLLLACFSQTVIFVQAQTETTGAFRGRVVDESGAPLPDATVRATNKLTGVPTATRTTSDGYFTLGLLQPGDYTLTVLKGDLYDVRTRDQRLTAVDATTVLPEPFMLKKRGAAIAVQPTPVPTGTQQPTTQATPVATAQASPTPENEGDDITIDINKRNARRGGVFTREEVSTLPLGATTLTRSFDELALLLPGVAPPPQTLGNIAGPGVGPGVGSSGQFSVNGLRSRSNNFTVDGSDNNDEDIGVRRQGFFSLVPQPIESIQEYQVTTLLAPAQYGRNIGAQVNANSRSGGSDFHGTIFGFFNGSQLNARDTFDSDGGGAGTFALRSGTDFNRAVLVNGAPLRVLRQGNGQDTLTLGQGGLVFGGPLEPPRCSSDVSPCPDSAKLPGRMFFFLSAEGQVLNATKESSFAVPTVEQRGFINSGATGFFAIQQGGGLIPSYPTALSGDAIFSLFPFANNPGGIYGANTYTAVLPASAQGKIISGKFDANFDLWGKPQNFTARYNFTDDWRDIPVTGGAIFSSLRPRVRTQNFSTFLTSPLGGVNSSRQPLNYLRLSYGRTRLIFDEKRDPSLRQSEISPNTPFLLNRQLFVNNTLPGDPAAEYLTFPDWTTELGDFFFDGSIGPVGQVNIAGFSPLGVDVFNFPQRRVNNTYQAADTLTLRFGQHNLTFGADTRRTELNSDLPRNARPLITFAGAPRLANSPFPRALRPEDLAAAGTPTGLFLTLSRGTSAINLKYYQLNFFGQDEWRINEHLSVNYGLRYEYNTVPQESSNRIESTFNAPELALLPGLRQYIQNRTSIYDPDRNNFGPRVGLAYSNNFFGNKTTVIRAGYGLYYDQIIGAVVSQSRNVYPTFLTLNTAGGSVTGGVAIRDFTLFNPAFSVNFGNNTICSQLNGNCYVVPGSVNRLNAPFADVVTFNRDNRAGGFGITLPQKGIESPMAHQFSVTFEQQLSRSMVLSAAYVGTLGRDLLRLTTPNLGPNVILVPLFFFVDPLANQPNLFGTVLAPGGNFTRPNPTAGSVNIYESSGRSRYDSLQVQLRGRTSFLGASSQGQVAYTYSKVKDDVSDVFDLAGAPALPQDSVTFAGEYAPANFDVRHRISYNYVTDLSNWGKRNAFAHFLFGGLQLAGTGFFQTGQPFTVNSIFDVNLDGNLTDRTNTTVGIQETGNRAQPYRLTTDPGNLRAALGQNGSTPRNAFRAGNLWLSNTSVVKTFKISENRGLVFRMDIFNVFNRANFGIPVRFLEAPAFGTATDTVTTGRRIQFAVKYSF
ncbi:MAG TPA: TonB-dependent receptor [Pyrinomonadaceae bacterium]|jgi:hypothetical protein